MQYATLSMQSPSDSRESDFAEHRDTYRKFVKFARAAACAAPFFVAFVLYWTT